MQSPGFFQDSTPPLRRGWVAYDGGRVAIVSRSRIRLMGYRTLQACLADLAATGRLVRIEEPIDPYLEAAEVQRRVYQAGGPAIYFANVKGCSFPMVSNLFGTVERVRYLFRDTLENVRRLVELKTDPSNLRRQPLRYLGCCRRRVVDAAAQNQRWRGARRANDDRSAAAVAVVAEGRRGVHHAAAGLYRRP